MFHEIFQSLIPPQACWLNWRDRRTDRQTPSVSWFFLSRIIYLNCWENAGRSLANRGPLPPPPCLLPSGEGGDLTTFPATNCQLNPPSSNGKVCHCVYCSTFILRDPLCFFFSSLEASFLIPFFLSGAKQVGAHQTVQICTAFPLPNAPRKQSEKNTTPPPSSFEIRL